MEYLPYLFVALNIVSKICRCSSAMCLLIEGYGLFSEKDEQLLTSQVDLVVSFPIKLC